MKCGESIIWLDDFHFLFLNGQIRLFILFICDIISVSRFNKKKKLNFQKYKKVISKGQCTCLKGIFIIILSDSSIQTRAQALNTK